jgi:myo-inositol-1(or 4)-monophosphatase
MRPFVIDLARRAGALLREGLERPRTIDLKSAFDLVTDMDRTSEALIVAALSERFPDHSIVAEEGGGVERAGLFRWVIDPLDGTNNYAHGFPYFSVSIGLLEGETPILGVVYDPLRDELFAAERGQGSSCNSRPLRVSQVTSLASALVSTGFPYDFGTRDDNNAREFARVQARCQGVRRAGSAALDLAYVAAGRLDAHWEIGLKPWDSAAGALLIAEAGGQLTDWHGAPWRPQSARLAATNGNIHNELLAVLNEE